MNTLLAVLVVLYAITAVAVVVVSMLQWSVDREFDADRGVRHLRTAAVCWAWPLLLWAAIKGDIEAAREEEQR